MVANSKAGTCPVVSMTDGTITNLGWTEKGGYRIGVTSDSGTYYYYAHLHSFGNKKRGDTVIAGEVIGFMGDSGYGEEGKQENSQYICMSEFINTIKEWKSV